MNDVINAKQLKGKYLEIGIRRDFTFEGIIPKDKTAVEPRMLLIRLVKALHFLFSRFLQINT
jgi:hypothetical protein